MVSDVLEASSTLTNASRKRIVTRRLAPKEPPLIVFAFDEEGSLSIYRDSRSAQDCGGGLAAPCSFRWFALFLF